MDRRVLKAYASECAGFGAKEELENYICQELKISFKTLDELYLQVTDKIKSHGAVSNEQFKQLIYLYYMDALEDAASSIKPNG